MLSEKKTQKSKTTTAIIIFIVLVALGVALAAAFHNQLDRFRSVLSVRKVADTRLLVMHYYGDYGFDEYLERGLQDNVSPPSGSINGFDWACTGFAALGNQNDSLLGRNFDWSRVKPLILYTDPPNGYASVSMVDITFLGVPTEDLSWPNRLRMIAAPYFPFDGMNEYGVGVGMMAIPLADGGKDPQKVTIGSLQVIRLILDHARNVEEAIALLQNFNVDFTEGPAIHYLIADASGNSVVVEYVKGKPAAIHNNVPWQVATNFNLTGKSLQIAESTCSRYKTAYETLRKAGGISTLEDSLLLLRDVSQPSTRWSIVYGLTSGKIRLVTDQNYEALLDFDLELKNNR